MQRSSAGSPAIGRESGAETMGKFGSSRFHRPWTSTRQSAFGAFPCSGAGSGGIRPISVRGCHKRPSRHHPGFPSRRQARQTSFCRSPSSAGPAQAQPFCRAHNAEQVVPCQARVLLFVEAGSGVEVAMTRSRVRRLGAGQQATVVSGWEGCAEDVRG